MKKTKVLCVVLALMLSLGSIAVYGDAGSLDRTEIDKKVNAQVNDLEKYLKDNANASNVKQTIDNYFKEKKGNTPTLSKEEVEMLRTEEVKLIKKVELDKNTFVKFYDDTTIQAIQYGSDKLTTEETMGVEPNIIMVLPWERKVVSAQSYNYNNGRWVCDQFVTMECEYNASDVRYYGNFSATHKSLFGATGLSKTHFKDSSNIIYVGKISGTYVYDFDTSGNPISQYVKTMIGINEYGEVVSPEDYGW